MLKNKFVYLPLVILLSVDLINGQKAATSVSFELENLYGRLTKNLNDSMKVQVNDSIRSLIESYAGSDTIFTHRFNNLRYLGQVTSPDSILKIVCWNLVLINQPGRYYCYIIKKQRKGVSNLIYRLTAEYSDDQIRTDTTYSAGSWYGALYYDIMPQTFSDKMSWVLLGINYGDPLITRKIIDILEFTQDSQILFGMRLFTSDGSVKHREVFEYSSAATMTLRFADNGLIIFDHLVPFSPEHTNDHQNYGPDYSNDAYIPENGLWRFRLNVDARNHE